MSWKDTIKESSWRDTVKENPSQLESAVRGGAQGIALNYADEITGGLEALKDIATTDKSLDDYSNLYDKYSAESRAAYDAAQAANPKTYLAGNIAGGVGTALATGNPASLMGRVALGAGMGGVAGSGLAEPGDRLKGAAMGAALGGTAAYGGDKLANALSSGAQKLSPKLAKIAEYFKERSIGGTAKQMEAIKPGTGRYMLENNIGGAFSSPASVAKAAQSGLDDAGGVMSAVLKELDDQGVQVNKANVIQRLEQEISQYAGDDSAVPVVNQIKNIINNIKETGQYNIKPSFAENIKQGYGKISKNWLNPDVGQAGKAAYGAYKNEVENVAENSSPVLADLFKDAKQKYSMLAPIKEVASNRAAVMNNQAIGGLNDSVAAQVGAQVTQNVPGMTAAAAGRRILAPRANSMIAHSTDFVSKLLKTAPEKLGTFSGVLNNAAERGTNSVAITDYLLSQQSPEYRQMKREMEDDGAP